MFLSTSSIGTWYNLQNIPNIISYKQNKYLHGGILNKNWPGETENLA